MFRKLDKQRRIILGADSLEFTGIKTGRHLLCKKEGIAVVVIRQEDNFDEHSEFLRYLQIDEKYRLTLPKDICEYVFGEENPEKVNVIVKNGEIQISLT